MTRLSLLAFFALSTALVACNSQSDHSEPANTEPPPALIRSSALIYHGLSGPERVLYDGQRDRYLVSNVDGEPAAADNNGFISVLSPDGTVTELRFIAGGAADTTLNAPKGLAIVDDVLYVADIDVVRRFNADTGAALGEIALPGSTFLNGLSADSDGRLYLSDSGPPQGTLDASGTETVYVVEPKTNKVRKLASGPLGRPTSLLAAQGGVIAASFGSNEVYQLNAAGKKARTSLLPAQGLAGVTQIGDWLYVTSWQASAIFRGKLGGAFELAIADLKSPSDLGFDSLRQRLLVPNFTEDQVEVIELQ
jgi:hypothetical protein